MSVSQGKTSAQGSSPLTRGKLRAAETRQRGPGLIPAHAGKTHRPPALRRHGTAHPRSRGENHRQARRGRSKCRLIPAHAGKTSSTSPTSWQGWAHPRSRGENTKNEYQELGTLGSSPLTRGKHVNSELCPHGRGLIPAHAGKTPSVLGSPRPPPAHPRSRGENEMSDHVREVAAGSSPLTRGKRERRRGSGARSGLIPAHAGKTWFPCRRRSIRWAHPRSRGENALSSTTPLTVLGSSPLTRGKLRSACPRGGMSGLIPAHAGKTA